MNTFAHIDGALHCEQVSLETIASRHGTPTYVYSHQTIQNAFLSYQQALEGRAHLICYAVKANSNLAVLNMLAQLGSGFDVVSLGELERVIAAGGDPAKIVFSGVGKTAPEMRRGLELGIKCFNIESEAELHVLAEIAGDAGAIAPISIRVNPDVDAGTHPYISTGLRENKFGVDVDTARHLYRQADAMNSLEPVGIDCHIGSQIVDIQPFIASLDCLLYLIDELKEDGISLHHLDIGGGLGVPYDTEAPSVKEYVSALAERLTDRDLELLLEPGRSIVADAGLLLTRVLHTKVAERKHFCVVDAAMNDLLRPSLYGAWQRIETVEPNKPGTPEILYDVVGPICEAGDFLGKDRPLATEPGHHLAILDAGAYGFGMGSNYNTRPRACEVLIEEGTARVIRRRESLDDLLAHELDVLKSS